MGWVAAGARPSCEGRGLGRSLLASWRWVRNAGGHGVGRPDGPVPSPSSRSAPTRRRNEGSQLPEPSGGMDCTPGCSLLSSELGRVIRRPMTKRCERSVSQRGKHRAARRAAPQQNAGPAESRPRRYSVLLQQPRQRDNRRVDATGTYGRSARKAPTTAQARSTLANPVKCAAVSAPVARRCNETVRSRVIGGQWCGNRATIRMATLGRALSQSLDSHGRCQRVAAPIVAAVLPQLAAPAPSVARPATSAGAGGRGATAFKPCPSQRHLMNDRGRVRPSGRSRASPR